MDTMTTDISRAKRILETALLTAQDPMPLAELRKLFEEDMGAETLRRLLDDLREDWSGRGIELVNVASGWRFRATVEMQPYLDRLHPQKPPKYSRAVLETLAIIAYRQPVSRGDVEDVRGVAVSGNIIKTLEARGWIEVVGHREVPGRPALFATTRQFLDDLNLRSIEELPALDDLGALVESEASRQPELAPIDRKVPGDGSAEGAESAAIPQSTGACAATVALEGRNPGEESIDAMREGADASANVQEVDSVSLPLPDDFEPSVEAERAGEIAEHDHDDPDNGVDADSVDAEALQHNEDEEAAALFASTDDAAVALQAPTAGSTDSEEHAAAGATMQQLGV